MIPPSQGDVLREAAGGVGRTIDGAGHTGLPAMDYSYFREVTDFMRQAIDASEMFDAQRGSADESAAGGPVGTPR